MHKDASLGHGEHSQCILVKPNSSSGFALVLQGGVTCDAMLLVAVHTPQVAILQAFNSAKKLSNQ